MQYPPPWQYEAKGRGFARDLKPVKVQKEQPHHKSAGGGSIFRGYRENVFGINRWRWTCNQGNLGMGRRILGRKLP